VKIRKALIPTTIWHDSELKQFGMTTMLTAIYLRSSPHSNMIYLYRLQPEYAAVDLGISVPEYMKALENLITIGFCKYDPTTNTIWLKSVMVDELGASLKASDNRAKGLQSLLKGLPETSLLKAFKSEFKTPYLLTKKQPENPLKIVAK